MVSDAPNPVAVPIRPAATVICLRDGAEAMEVLLLRRDTELAFHGGSWVFPGGRVDADELEAASGDELAAARVAAVREAYEEAGLRLTPTLLVPFSHWTTPFGRNRRFATWFFVTGIDGDDVVIDDGEIRDFAWHPLERAITGCESGDIALAGPTYVSLLRLRDQPRVAEAISFAAGRSDEVFRPKLAMNGDVRFSLYEGDAGYELGDAGAAGPRHRMEMRERGYRYVNDADPPADG
ncbi:MAG: NUDIX hydrolase [Actinomycetota bacterium]